MATSTIVIGVLLCLFILIAVTFTLQQIEKNNREKSALIAALKGQVRNFQFMLEGFPEGLLNRDLKLLVCQCIAENLDQLLRLERNNSEYQQLQQQLNAKIAQLNTQPANSSQYQPLTDPAQIQDVQKLLHSLFNVIQRLYQNKRLNTAQTNSYSSQVQRLATRIALDANLAAAQAALQNGKPRLAVHHYKVVIDKMSKDNADGAFTEQIAMLQQRCAQLDTQAASQPQNSPLNDAWKNFEQNTKEEPLKKSVYD
jgi:hypothetical protein